MSDSSNYLIFDNPDKQEKRRLGPGEFMPFSTDRILLSGLPGCGKRNLILNMIYRMQPPPCHVLVVHVDPETHEYDEISRMGIPMYIFSPDSFPTAENVVNPVEELEEEEEKKGPLEARIRDPQSEEESPKPAGSPLVIVDEITESQLSKEGKSRFERLVNFVCTHRNTALLCSIQSLTNIPPKCRRGFNHYALWKQNDAHLNKLIESRCGIDHEFMEALFDLCKTRHDFIYIDTEAHRDSGWRYRLNWMSPVFIEPNPDYPQRSTT